MLVRIIKLVGNVISGMFLKGEPCTSESIIIRYTTKEGLSPTLIIVLNSFHQKNLLYIQIIHFFFRLPNINIFLFHWVTYSSIHSSLSLLRLFPSLSLSFLSVLFIKSLMRCTLMS